MKNTLILVSHQTWFLITKHDLYAYSDSEFFQTFQSSTNQQVVQGPMVIPFLLFLSWNSAILYPWLFILRLIVMLNRYKHNHIMYRFISLSLQLGLLHLWFYNKGLTLNYTKHMTTFGLRWYSVWQFNILVFYLRWLLNYILLRRHLQNYL